MFTAQFDKINRISWYTDSKLRIFFRVFHCIFQHFAVQDIYIQVVCAFGEVTVHHGHQVLNTGFHIYTEWFRNDRECVADTILGIAVTKFCHRTQRGDGTILVASVHGVGARSKSNTFGTSVGSRTGFLTIHHIGGNSQQWQGGTGIFVNRMFLQFFAEEVNQVYA